MYQEITYEIEYQDENKVTHCLSSKDWDEIVAAAEYHEVEIIYQYNDCICVDEYAQCHFCYDWFPCSEVDPTTGYCDHCEWYTSQH